MYAPPRDGPPRGPPGPGGPPRGGPPPLEFPPEPNIIQEVQVLRKYVGMIIGPGGEVAGSIRKAARCGLHVRKNDRTEEQQVVEISGNPEQVKNPCM